MCGIAGIYQKRSSTVFLREAIGLVSNSLSRRGPDDSGIWVDEENGFSMGHRRLAILDLSPAGHQPMECFSGRYVIVFNGEIYNHLELRSALELEYPGFVWKGHSDTETLLACFAVWGVEKTLRTSIGMFAIALWDRREKVLILARDRFGEKPLYYGFMAKYFMFASELKAFKAYPDARLEVDSKSIHFLLKQSNIPAPYSIYKGVSKVLPGHYLVFRLTDAGFVFERQHAYWSLQEVVTSGQKSAFSGARDFAIDDIEAALSASIKRQMISDVPIGAFLSGGIDSSVVVALMQKHSVRPIKTFTIGFSDAKYNEANYAKAVSMHLHTDHTELYVKSSDALELIADLPRIFCEPFSDSSQIPTYLVSRLAAQDVTVALSGDGGDEVFGGYEKYLMAVKYWDKLEKLPPYLRLLMVVAIRHGPLPILSKLAAVLSRARSISDLQFKLESVLQLCAMQSEADFFNRMSFKSSTGLLVNPECYDLSFGSDECLVGVNGSSNRMMMRDTLNYLHNDILTKVDRAAMANSLETRVPMLDHNLVEAAWRLPANFKIYGGRGKWILRQILYRYVPQELIDRPKKGFGVPLATWLRGPLRDWAEDLLSEKRLSRDGYFNAKAVRALFDEHISCKRDNQYKLWDILIFQAWADSQ